MSISDSDRVDAGEYALALEEADERRRFEAALIDDPELSQAVWSWEESFRPLADAVRPRPAPSRVWRSITARLFGADLEMQRKMRRATAFWRDAALTFMSATAVAAACLVVVVARPELVGGDFDDSLDPHWVAALVRLDGSIALVRVADNGHLIAEPMNPNDPARDSQLWLVSASGDPVSLGLLEEEQRSDFALPQGAVQRINVGAQFVVTSEPEGGSPTGQPTGQAIGSGSLTRI